MCKKSLTALTLSGVETAGNDWNPSDSDLWSIDRRDTSLSKRNILEVVLPN